MKDGANPRGAAGGGHRRRHGHGHPPAHGASLADCAAGVICAVVSNPDRKTVEMGLCRGALLHVFRNSSPDSGLVVGVGDARYVIARSTAAAIRVRPPGDQFPARPSPAAFAGGGDGGPPRPPGRQRRAQVSRDV
ncbi:MAG: ferrous iron transport protein A [Lentisphaerae bacterium]|nr:ferrous iron transport protein A [Lentisphaerota bacterium]